MSAPRFRLRELEGYTVSASGAEQGGSAALVLDVMVLDSAYSWRVVRLWSTARNFTPRLSRAHIRPVAAAECARLNAEHEAWLAEAVA